MNLKIIGCVLIIALSLLSCRTGKNAQNKKGRKATPVITDYKLSKKDITTKKAHFTHLGQFVSQVPRSRQGASVYDNYLVQAHDRAGVAIFDISSHEVVKTGYLQPKSDSNHCNNICFSSLFYKKTDKFPLLYVSENRTFDISVNRLASLESEFELVQHITLPKEIGHFLNAVFDFENNFIYTICYKENNWRTNEGSNHVVVSKLRLPKVSEGDVTIDKIIDQFTVPFQTATQGAFFANGYIVQGFGINKNAEDDALLFIDIDTKQVIDKLGTHDVFQDEIEGVTPYGRNSIIVTLQKGNVFRVDFE